MARCCETHLDSPGGPPLPPGWRPHIACPVAMSAWRYRVLQLPRLQAMAAYRTAARLFPGLAAPLAGLGTEYARLNNMPLAEHMFAAATRRARPWSPKPVGPRGVHGGHRHVASALLATDFNVETVDNQAISISKVVYFMHHHCSACLSADCLPPAVCLLPICRRVAVAV